MNTFTHTILEVSKELEIVESLDSSYEISPAISYNITDAHKKVGIDSHKEYDLDNGDAGVLTIYHRNGAYEIHHHIKDPNNAKNTIQGQMIGNDKPNPKFVGTMYAIGKRIVDSGNALRIVGNHTNGMFDHYNRIATIIAKRNKDTKISPPKPYDYPGDEAKDYSEITISKIGDNAGLMKESFRMVVNGRTKKNNYGLGYTQSWLNIQEMTIDEIMDDLLKC